MKNFQIKKSEVFSLHKKIVIFETRANNVIYYIRDEEGSLIGLKHNDTMYYYVKNMQEDIIGITDSNNNLLCSYVYDSWRNIISIKDNDGNIINDTSHIGIINPYRYRSYYYDEETKLYYLNSRYYNPEWGRFINADRVIIGNINALNLYVYSKNNPIIMVDNAGNFPTLIKDLFKKVATNIIRKVTTIVTKISRYVSIQNKISKSDEQKKIKFGPVTISKIKTNTKTSNKEKNINLYSTNMNSVGASVKSGKMTTSLDVSEKEIALSSGDDKIQVSSGFSYEGLNSTLFVSGTYNYNIEDSVTYRVDVDIKFVIFGYAWSKIPNPSQLIPVFSY